MEKTNRGRTRMSDKEKGNTKEEENNEENSVQEKEVTRDEMVDKMLLKLSADYPDKMFTFTNITDIKYDLIDVMIDDNIIFRQIIDMSFSVEENKTRIQGSYERSLRAYKKLSEEYMTKYGQEIILMNQAEVISVRKVKDAEKGDK